MLRSSLLVFAIAVYGNSQIADSRKLPSYFEKCKLDPKFLDECFLRNVDIIKPHLIAGIPEMRIPSVEPLHLPLIQLSMNNFNATYKDVHIHNASIFSVHNVKSDLAHSKLHIEVNFPYLRIEADYETNGKLLVLELHGSGKSQSNITDAYGIVDMQGERYQKNGKTFLDFNNNKLSLKIGSVQSHFSNLFAQNEELTAATNRVLNENSREFLEELRPVMEETISTFIFSVITNVFKSYSLEDLFIS